jgi:hypothetical protein
LAKTSPTQRSLKTMRDRGYHAEVTEHWNPFAKIRKDLFGFVDIVAIGGGETVAVQTTSYSNISARREKILASPLLKELLDAKWSVRIHGWKKAKNGRWELKEEHVTG